MLTQHWRREERTSVVISADHATNLGLEILKYKGDLEIPDFRDLVLGLLYLRHKSIVNSTTSDIGKVGAGSWSRIMGALGAPGLVPTIHEAFNEVIGSLGNTSRGDLRPIIDVESIDDLLLTVNSIESNDHIRIVFDESMEKFLPTGNKGGKAFTTPHWLSELFVQIADPSLGTLYDPCCGTGGLLINSWRHIQHKNKEQFGLLHGQECHPAIWRICKMRLDIHGIPCNLGREHADLFKTRLHNRLKADFIFADPPFNQKYKKWEPSESVREEWKFGTPTALNTNYAWIQHFIERLTPTGVAVFTMSNGSMSSLTSGEGDIRRKIIEADLVDCIIALPTHLFSSTGIPACVWVISQSKYADSRQGRIARDRHQKTLFINAQQMGRMIDRVHRVLDPHEIFKIASTYRAWRGDSHFKYADVPNFCRACDIQEIASRQYILMPSRYVQGSDATVREENRPETIEILCKKLDAQFKESSRLERLIRERIERLGSGS